MPNVAVHRDDVDLDEPMLVEGLPGVGLVGKITADHLVDTFEMVHYASLHHDGLPEIAVYQDGDPTVQAPVRLYADEDRDLLVLQSDVPVSPNRADAFADSLTGWLNDQDVTPVYLSGLPAEKDDVPSLWGIATGDAADLLSAAEIDPPAQRGAISGPTGALIHAAERADLDGVGLIVEADRQFPDPEAARVVLVDAIEPLADISVDTESLVDKAEEISQAKSEMAKRMQDAGDESTEARPLGMYQ